MADFTELRQKYPEYDDLSDDALARAFHGKFYSDMDFSDFSAKIGLAPSSAPSGYDLIETFEGGGRVIKSQETGRESFVSPRVSTSDPDQIAKFRAAGGDAEAVVERDIAKETVGKVGEMPARFLSALKGMPFVGSYVDEGVGAAFGPEAGKAVRSAQRARETLAPKTVAASRFATGVASAVPAIAALPTLATAPLGTSLAARAATGLGMGAVGGAIEGAVYGFGEGDTKQERFKSLESGAKTGALIGGALGPLGPLVGAGIGAARSRGVTAPARELGQQIQTKGEALGLLSEAARMDAPVADEAMRKAGQYASLGMMGPATRNLLDLAASSTSEGAAIARQNIDEVAGEAGQQFTQLLDNSFGGPQAAQAVEDTLMQSTSGQRSALYDEAYGAAIDYSGADGVKLEELLSRLDSGTIRNAEKLMRRERPRSSQIKANLDEAGNVVGYETLPNVVQIDYMTRALNNVSPTAAPEDKNTAQALAGQIRKSLDAIVPEYRAARDFAGDVISVRNAIDLGANAFKTGNKTTRYALSEAVKGMAQAEKSALKQGVRSYVDEVMANTKAALNDPNQDVREMVAPLKDMMSRSGREKLAIILGGEADEFVRQLDEIYSVMSMRASVAQNTKTQIRKMAQDASKDRIGQSVPELMGERGPVTGLLEGLRRQVTDRPSQQQAFERLMGEIATPLARQSDLETLRRQIPELRQAAPQLQRGRDIYEAGKRYGTIGATALTPAMQSLMNMR